ncbi:glycerophosphodiester phosphodiesterase family protein [Qipengyuania nanhaisediminis]|uniref:glycerophosphodiester phosphodiesterase family protein n=1 Tax=Qipengyuania nanhaisediminis TaxID=604088 RepID=UPI0038B2CBD5
MSRRRAPEWLTRWEYAHRGLHSVGAEGVVPENSLAAAEAAIAAGLGIECDIQRSADGLAMVFHDWDLDRLTDGTGAMERLSAEDIAHLRLHGSAESPARLEALLELVRGRVPILVELKSKPGYDIEKTCQGVRRAISSYDGLIAIMSFDPRVSSWVRQHAPELVCGLVMREDKYGYTQTEAERGAALREAEPDFLAYHVLALPNERVARLRDDGMPILTWTVDSLETRALALAHADALVSEGEGLA